MTQRTKRFRFSRRCHYKFHALLMNIHSPPRHPLTSGARNAPKCKGCLGTICKGCHGPEHFGGKSAEVTVNKETEFWRVPKSAQVTGIKGDKCGKGSEGVETGWANGGAG